MEATPFSVLIPAAGASKRLGQAKQLVQFQGKPLLGHVLDIVRPTLPIETIVVTGANEELLGQFVDDPHVRWIHNANWPDGLGSSIAAGAKAVSTASGGVLVMLCDQYRVETGDLQTLVNTWRSGPEQIVAAEASGRCMPPAVFPASLLGALQALSGDRGARHLFLEHSGRLTTITMEHAAIDLDTPGQLDRMRATHGQGPSQTTPRKA